MLCKSSCDRHGRRATIQMGQVLKAYSFSGLRGSKRGATQIGGVLQCFWGVVVVWISNVRKPKRCT